MNRKEEEDALRRAQEKIRQILDERDLPWTVENVQMIVKEHTDKLIAEGKIARSDQGKLYKIGNSI